MVVARAQSKGERKLPDDRLTLALAQERDDVPQPQPFNWHSIYYKRDTGESFRSFSRRVKKMAGVTVMTSSVDHLTARVDGGGKFQATLSAKPLGNGTHVYLFRGKMDAAAWNNVLGMEWVRG